MFGSPEIITAGRPRIVVAVMSAAAEEMGHQLEPGTTTRH